MSVQRERVDGERGPLARKPELEATKRRTEEMASSHEHHQGGEPGLAEQ
jgi:hypothetical protein